MPPYPAWNVNPRYAPAYPPVPSVLAGTAAQRDPGPPPAPEPQSDVAQYARRLLELVRSAKASGRIRQVPVLDELTEETTEIRSYYRPMLREPVVKAALLSKVGNVAALDVQAQPEDPDNPREREAAECLLWCLRKLPGGTRKLAHNVLLPGLIDGHSVCEKVYDPQPVRRGRWAGKQKWKFVKGKDTETLRLQTDPYLNITALKPTAYSVGGETFPPEKFIVWSHFSLFERPLGMSDLRAAYRAFTIKNEAWQYRALFLEKFSSPYLVGKYATSTLKTELQAALAAAQGSTWVAIPKDLMEIEAISLASMGTADYASAIADCDKEMLVGITNGYLQMLEGRTPDGRGDTSIHQEGQEALEWMLASELSDVVNAQMVCEWYEINYADVAPATLTWGSINEADLAIRLNVDKGLQEMGLPLSKREAYRYYARQIPADPDDTLVPPALAPAGPSLPFGEDPTPEPAPKYIDAAVQQLLAGGLPSWPANNGTTADATGATGAATT